MQKLKLIETKNNNNYCYDEVLKEVMFKKKELSIVTSRGEIRRFMFIVLENIKTGIFKPTIFSSYFNNYSNNLINREINTKFNHAVIIVNFLNYIFISNYNKYGINDIKHITIEMGNDFLRDYGNGIIGGNKNKSELVIDSANSKLSNFYLYLFKQYDLKYVKQNSFEYLSNNNNDKIKNLFLVAYPPSQKMRRIKHITIEIVGELLRIAEELYPEITLGLAFQAFGGLRAGEVCCLTTYAVNYYSSLDGINWLELDLRQEFQLREDKTQMGQIKKHRIQPIHPAFMPTINYLYNKHMKIIAKHENQYHPLFLNNRGKAMSQRTYYDKFGEVRDKLIERLSSNKDIYIRSQANLLMSGKFSTHTLRYFFTQFIASLPEVNSSSQIAYWRGDSTLDAAIIYLSSSYEISDKIEKIQNETMKSILGERYHEW